MVFVIMYPWGVFEKETDILFFTYDMGNAMKQANKMVNSLSEDYGDIFYARELTDNEWSDRMKEIELINRINYAGEEQ